MEPIEARAWNWDKENPATDKLKRPFPYTFTDINGKLWHCKNCRGIYFKIMPDNTVACYSCGRPMYS